MITRLLVEHDQILRTLNFLEMQYLDLCRGGIPDYSLMQSVLEYIQEYPEQVHHPLEDKIYSILLERVDEVELLQNLMEEHEELEALTRKLSESLKLLQSNTISSEDIKAQLSTFLIKQRRHMYLEEELVHPLIVKVLTNSEWEQIQSSVPLYKGK